MHGAFRWLLLILLSVYNISCVSILPRTSEDVQMQRRLAVAINNHPETVKLLARQFPPQNRNQHIFVWVRKNKTITADCGQEWPDLKPEGALETRLSNTDIAKLGEIVFEVVESQQVQGELRFVIYKKNQRIVVYSKKL
jgi:hypothetical protein